VKELWKGIGRFGNTQMTINNQIFIGTLMNLEINPTRMSIGKDWREFEITNHVPIFVLEMTSQHCMLLLFMMYTQINFIGSQCMRTS